MTGSHISIDPDRPGPKGIMITEQVIRTIDTTTKKHGARMIRPAPARLARGQWLT